MIKLYIALATLNLLAAGIFVALPGNWALRALAIIGATFATLTVLWAVPDTSGRPTSRDLPETQVVACYVDEPTFIYFWILDGSVPVSYRQPYTRQLHQACESIAKAAQQGVRVGLKKSRGHGQPNDTRVTRHIPYLLPPLGGVKEDRE